MFTNSIKRISLIASGAIFTTVIGSQTADAAMISPISASTSNTTDGSLTNTINQTGLSATYNPTTDFDSFVTSTTHALTTPDNSVGILPATGIVTYGFGGAFNISAFGLWNGNGAVANFGIEEFSLFADNDNNLDNGTLGQLGNFIATQGPLGQTFNFTATSASFVHLQVIDNYGGVGGTIFGEVAFKTAEVPEPLTILGTATALGFGALFKKKLSNRNELKQES